MDQSNLSNDYEEVREVVINRYLTLVEELDSIFNLARLSKERKEDLINKLNLLLDLKGNLLMLKLVKDGVINEESR